MSQQRTKMSKKNHFNLTRFTAQCVDGGRRKNDDPSLDIPLAIGIGACFSMISFSSSYTERASSGKSVLAAGRGIPLPSFHKSILTTVNDPDDWAFPGKAVATDPFFVARILSAETVEGGVMTTRERALDVAGHRPFNTISRSNSRVLE